MSAAGETRIHALSSPDRPSRTLTVDFDAFVARIVSLGEPERGRLDALMAGLDLIRAMDSETDDFGRAAPGTDDRIGFAERLAALTDEAFEAASLLLGEADRRDEHQPPTPETVLARAVIDLAFDADLYPALVRTIAGASPECDPGVGEEFL